MTTDRVYSVSEKLVISGDFVEHYQYEKNYFVGFPRLFSPTRFLRAKTTPQERIRADNVRRTRQKVRRLINSNKDLLKFMTLTFDDPVIDLASGNKLFDVFIKKMRRLYPDLKYIAVPEFQKKSKKLHYHLLTNIKEYISNDYLADELWQNGYAWLRETYNIDNLGAYVSKYLSKEIFDERYFKKRKFLYSFNLLKPIIIDKFKEVKRVLNSGFDYFYNKIFDKTIDSDFLGVIQYKQYKCIDIVN